MADELYCGPGDLIIDPTLLYEENVKETAVQQACEEIDSRIGRLYRTPIDVSESSSVDRSVKLLIKSVAIHLASGRLVMRLTDVGQDSVPNAYGKYLITQAYDVLNEILSGDIVLVGVPAPDVDPGERPAIASPQMLAANAVEPVSLDGFQDYMKFDPFRWAVPPWATAPYGPAYYTQEG